MVTYQARALRALGFIVLFFSFGFHTFAQTNQNVCLPKDSSISAQQILDVAASNLNSPNEKTEALFNSLIGFVNNDESKVSAQVIELRKNLGEDNLVLIVKLFQHYERWNSQFEDGVKPDFKKIKTFQLKDDPDLVKEFDFSAEQNLRQAVFENIIPKLLSKTASEEEKEALTNKLYKAVAKLELF